jgi:hypothetical protein
MRRSALTFSADGLMPRLDVETQLERIPIGSIQFGVIAGQSPRSVSALMTRRSILFAKRLYAKRMDPRIKSAGDGGSWRGADSKSIRTRSRHR